ncbi:hypothetical protein OG21DRAFT_1477771 [Imleria badia]|nr:hypothetical protein OG21DRAFT_1477771 [Imleria badia]
MSTPLMRSSRCANTPLRIPCKFPNCKHWFGNKSGLTQHINRFHPDFQTSIPMVGNLASSGSVSIEPDNDPIEPSSGGIRPPQTGTEDEAVNSQWHGPGAKLYRNYHTKMTGLPCDANGEFLPPGSPPPPRPERPSDDWRPFNDCAEFELADLLYTRIQMSAGNINQLLDIFAACLHKHGGQSPFSGCAELYNAIDSLQVGDIGWESFGVAYSGDRTDCPAPWMDNVYDVWMRDPETAITEIVGDAQFQNLLDLAPYREYDSATNTRRWQDFMSGDWAWDEADTIAHDPATHGALMIPIILGSDKTTVSVATGQHNYYPLYLSIGNLHNTARRAHKNSVKLSLILLATKAHAATPAFRKFRCQLFHHSLSKILERLRPYMSKWKLLRFADGYFQRVIFTLGPYIADYEEQVLLSCIMRNWCPKCMSRNKDLDVDVLYRCQEHTDLLVEDIDMGVLWDEYGIVSDLVPFTNDFPRANIYLLLTPDILHQLIKGAFKDHLVEWIEKFIKRNQNRHALNVLDDIDQRIAAVASFAGLRRFPQGRNFKQWTGDDSKALMKVYMPAINGHVPVEMVHTLRAFLEFCYLVRRNVIDENSLNQIQDALRRFYQFCGIFKDTNVVNLFSLPRQHSMKHYVDMIRLFGAPNGLCSSITESKHIKAVKEPYRRSNRNQPLGQMLLINQRLEKLAAARSDFTARGMLNSPILQALQDEPSGSYEEDIEGAEPIDLDPTAVEARVRLMQTIQRSRARTVHQLGGELSIPNIVTLLATFLFDQQHQDDGDRRHDLLNIPEHNYPYYDGKIKVVNSASASFYAPSDASGIHGMRREFIQTDPMSGLEVVHVLAFFSFYFKGIYYPCAAVHWFDRVGDEPDEDTGMWLHQRGISIIHIDSIYRAAHLIPVYGKHIIPSHLHPHHSYDSFHLFYVNRFADHHAFEIAS